MAIVWHPRRAEKSREQLSRRVGITTGGMRSDERELAVQLITNEQHTHGNPYGPLRSA
jgi:hypothetical protein